MIKRFLVKNIEVQVKTNVLKDNECYFGVEEDIKDVIKTLMNKIQFEQHPKNEESLFITLDKELRANGIKAYKIIGQKVIYMGEKMSCYTEEVEQQKVVVKEKK